MHAVHKSQLLTYLRLTDKRLGLLINFNVTLIRDGITQVVNGLDEGRSSLPRLAALMVSPFAGLAARNPAIIEPRAELVAEIETRWRAATEKPIRVVMGDPRLAAAASWSMASGPLGWPDYDLARAPWITPWLVLILAES